MKCITSIACIILAVNMSHAQTWKEWFKQKKTQKEYLVKQIAALEVYLDYLKEGYDIAQKGLNMVGDIKGRNFQDHQGHFRSLKIVKDDLGDNSSVRLILSRQVAIMTEFRELKKFALNSESLSEEEVRYVDLVYSNLLTECERSIAALYTVVTDDAFQMSDDERIERIHAICHDMNDKYAFTRTFCGSTRVLIMQRDLENQEIGSLRKLNGVL